MIDFPDTVSLNISGETWGYSLPSTFSVGENGVVHMESVELGGATITATLFKEIVGPVEYDRQLAMVQEWWSEEGWKEWEMTQ